MIGSSNKLIAGVIIIIIVILIMLFISAQVFEVNVLEMFPLGGIK